MVIRASPTPLALRSFVRTLFVWVKPREPVILASTAAVADPPVPVGLVPPQAHGVVLGLVLPVAPVLVGEGGRLPDVRAGDERVVVEVETLDHELLGTRRLLFFFLVFERRGYFGVISNVSNLCAYPCWVLPKP